MGKPSLFPTKALPGFPSSGTHLFLPLSLSRSVILDLPRGGRPHQCLFFLGLLIFC